MKRIALMIIPALICGTMFEGCRSDKEEPQEEKPTGELYVMGTRSTTGSSKGKMDLLFTGDDIESFKTGTTFEVPNGGTYNGEIVFNNRLIADELLTRIGLFSTVFFYLHDKLLFDPPIKIYHPLSSISSNDLQMNINTDGRVYLSEFYQHWDWMSAAERNVKLKEQEENSKMRRKQLDLFFKYLNDAGKIDNTVPPDVEEPTFPEVPAVQDSTKVK